jgi:hypothetical protein
MVTRLIDELDNVDDAGSRQKDGKPSPRFPMPRRKNGRRVMRLEAESSLKEEPARPASVGALESGPAHDVDHPEKVVASIPPQDYVSRRAHFASQSLHALVSRMRSDPHALFRIRELSIGTGSFSVLAILEQALDIREPDSEIPVPRGLWNGLLKAAGGRQGRTAEPVSPHAMVLQLLRAGGRLGALVTACRVKQFLGTKERPQREAAYVILLVPEASELASSIIAAHGENGWGLAGLGRSVRGAARHP